MKSTPSRLTPRRARLVKGLTLCCIFTLLASLAFSAWYTYTSGFSAVLDADQIELIQLDAPKAGDPIAVMHTTLGDMTYVLYPEQAPETVAAFTKRCEAGEYDGTYVFRVEQDVFFSGGAQNADGSLSEGMSDSPAEQIPRELSPKLWPLRGALCALTTKADAGFFRTLSGTQSYYTGSRFLVCDSIEMTDEIVEGLQSEAGNNMDKVAAAFLERGGIPNYSQQIAVFGQLIDGFDVLDAITGAELTGEENAMKPVDEIKILSIEVNTFG